MSSGVLRRLSREDGIGVITATILMALMLGVGLASFAYVDEQQREAGVERFRESSFNLTEGALNVQSYVLGGAGWPGTAASANPSTCTQAGPRANGCPEASEMTKSFTGHDFGGSTWETRVRDNGLATMYVDSQPSWDANGDGRLWVRAQGRVQGRPRVLLGQVVRDAVREQFPRKLLLAGKVATSNRGNKVIVDTQGSAGQAAPVAVRCDPAVDPACLDYSPGQVAPNSTETGYASSTTALSPEAIERLRATAMANGTHYSSGCPANPSGSVVFVETATPVACSYNNSSGSTFNAPGWPGLFIVANGTFSLSGNVTFYGIVYALNRQASTDSRVVEVTGTALIQGSVFVDGAGGVLFGSSGLNVIHDPGVFEAVTSYGPATLVPDTFRELPPY